MTNTVTKTRNIELVEDWSVLLLLLLSKVLTLLMVGLSLSCTLTKLHDTSHLLLIRSKLISSSSPEVDKLPDNNPIGPDSRVFSFFKVFSLYSDLKRVSCTVQPVLSAIHT